MIQYLLNWGLHQKENKVVIRNELTNIKYQNLFFCMFHHTVVDPFSLKQWRMLVVLAQVVQKLELDSPSVHLAYIYHQYPRLYGGFIGMQGLYHLQRLYGGFILSI